MRVLMISKACVVGIYQRKLEEIARLGVDLTVVVPPMWADRSGTLTLERAYLEGYRMVVLSPRFNGNFHLHFYPGLGRLIRDTEPEIVHIDEEPYNLVTWLALWRAQKAGAKSLFFSWQNILRSYPPPFLWGEAWTLQHADYALMGTESAANVFRAKGYRGSLAVIPQFGIDPDLFQPQNHRRNEIPVIGFIGRLVPEKGAEVLLRAATLLRQQGVPFRLQIVGQGPRRTALEMLALKEGIGPQVEFTGQVPSTHMNEVYPGLDMLIIPSLTMPTWKEQFGRVIVEAMASGIPVIGSNSGAIPDVIGDAGVIVPEGDEKALAEAIQALINDPERWVMLSRTGRARVLERFTHASVAAATVKVYEEILTWR